MRERSFSSVGRVNPSFSWVLHQWKVSNNKAISSIQSNLKMHLPTPIRGLLIITPMHLQFFFSFVTKPPWNICDENTKKKVAQSQTKGIFDSLILSTFLINFIWVLLSQLEIPTIFWWSYWLVYWSYGLVPLRLLRILRILRILRGIYFHPKKNLYCFRWLVFYYLNFIVCFIL